MSVTGPELGRRAREVRVNVNRSLTPQSLGSALDSFEAGYLRQAALIWEHIEDKDDAAKIAVPKRRKSVSRQKWTVLKLEETPQAEADAEALSFFYNNATCTVATDLNVRGGIRKLINFMMKAEFYQYAAFEIIWQPKKNAAGRQLLTAEFRFVPLYFFENRTGQLRYCGSDLATDGETLDENGWLIHSGDGLHKALSICALLKKYSLQDWVNFSEKFSIPGVHGECPAAVGSPEWLAFVEALDKFANDFVIASTPGAKITLIEAGKTGDQPFAPMVERMDRRITALCRGADLGTISSKDSTGASLQGEETNILLEDDCENITETLNTTVDRFVLSWVNGPDREARAYFKLQAPVQTDTKLEMLIDKHLVELGGELDAADTYERYDRVMPEGMKATILKKSAATATALPVQPPEVPAENDAANLGGQFLGVESSWLEPIRDLFSEIEEKAMDKSIGDAELLVWLDTSVARIPELFADMDITAFADFLEAALGGAAVDGIRESLHAKSAAKKQTASAS